jgi:1-deoxy-D-xylulose-5-phosphate reductoisomerase
MLTQANIKPQQVCILGATGSIGGNTLSVMAQHPHLFKVFALTAHSRINHLQALCLLWRPQFAVVATLEQAQHLGAALRAQGLTTDVLHGASALSLVAAHPEVDVVMAAIVGAAGLEPCLAAAQAGKKLLLANKEALVVGGALFMHAVEKGNATLVPIDSEHSAIFQCLPPDRRAWSGCIDQLVLTASGGPFRNRALNTFKSITPDEACAHPNWSMGRKISVDSATMMNKALEVIEAHWLFGTQPDQIKVLIHPQSIVHSMVVCPDGSVLAQMGTPDMRAPIAYGLSFPERLASGAKPLDFISLQALSFEAVAPERFPGLSLAWQALQGLSGSTAILNAANEVAVAAFLQSSIRFDQIHAVNLATLEAQTPWPQADSCVADLIELDTQARRVAKTFVARCAS